MLCHEISMLVYVVKDMLEPTVCVTKELNKTCKTYTYMIAIKTSFSTCLKGKKQNQSYKSQKNYDSYSLSSAFDR